MDKLLKYFLDFTGEESGKKTKILVNILFYFNIVIISIWFSKKLNYKFIGFDFTAKFVTELFADLTIIVPLFLFLIISSISWIVVYLGSIIFYYILRFLRYISYKKNTRKNNLLILKWKKVVDNKDKKIVKGEKFNEYILNMISYKNILPEFKGYPKKIPVVILTLWFIYFQIVRVQFENLYFLWFFILLSIFLICSLFLMGYLKFISYKLSLDEKYLKSFGLLDNDYSKSTGKS